ncbi:MFS transporter [Bradyrhizobium sp. 2TAF24]|uniref:MFS transporter n=1 Tax=Bradyrhizobium sp. 2TAF24 TaxID=3233011 RepID=UPI003F9376B5
MRDPAAADRSSPTLTLIATGIGVTLIILDVTVVNVALERIQATFATSVTGLQWVMNAYTLAFASLMLTAGALGDRLGARRVFVAGFVLFTLASLACGMATGLAMLVVARVVQGIGAALCLPSSLALLSVSFPAPAAKAKAVAIWSAIGGLALAAGPVVGGILVDRLGWPSIFFINLPFGALGIWLTLRYAPPAARAVRRGLDPAGQILAIVALCGLTTLFIQSGPLGWLHPLVIASGVMFVVAAATFIVVESRSPDPMLPLMLFRSGAVSASCIVGLLTNFAFYGLMFVLSLFFQVVKGFSPLQAGLAFLPMTALVTIGNLVAGWLTARYGARLPMVAGQALAAAGYLALASIGSDTSYAAIIAPLLAAGFGTSLTVPSMTTAVLAHVERQRAGIASGVLNAARQIGGVIGVGAFGSLIAAHGGDLIGGMRLAQLAAGAALVLGCGVSAFGLPVPARSRPCPEGARPCPVSDDVM